MSRAASGTLKRYWRKLLNVAALYVETNGVYYDLPGVDPWDEARDARKYQGPHPVVAHPPCQRWTNLACLNYKRYGGEHNRPGNDRGCFKAAFKAVTAWGGVLEHPKSSRAWHEFGLTKPKARCGWTCDNGLWTCEVWQSAYGHKARKATWLLYCGVNPPPDLNWTRNPGTHQIGWFDRVKPTLSKAESKRTPIPFRDLLLSIARSARV